MNDFIDFVERVHQEARNRALVWTRDRASC